VIFLYQLWLQCSVIFVNYQGRPFTVDLTENGKLHKFILAMFGLAVICIMDMSDLARDSLELVPFPSVDFQQKMVAALVLDLALCYSIEKTVKHFYLRSFQ